MIIMTQKSQVSSLFDENKLNDYLMRSFHFPSFKSDEQKEAIQKVLKRQFDVIVSLPNGCGRSLCYQLPALINSPKLTIVFCSQLDRIKEQITNMARFHINSATYLTELSMKEQILLLQSLIPEIGNVMFTLLYVTPVVAFSSAFKIFFNQLAKKRRLANIVLDETHCEIDWIYGPKNDYMVLGLFREMYMEIPWVVITNTVCSDVINHMSTVLKLNTPHNEKYRFTMPSFRSNIYYDIVYEDDISDTTRHIKQFVDQCYKNKQESCGMIFCKRSDEAIRVAVDLKKKGLNIASYHMGLKDDEQLSIKNEFMREQIKIIATTGSFGMKINKSNVHFVIHLGLPSNILQYYYQSGQAGKGGQPVHCRIYLSKQSTLYYNANNLDSWECAVRNAKTLVQRETANRNLKIFINSCKMIEFCEEKKCKHSVFADYFGDLCKKPHCINKCSACLNKKKDDDYDTKLVDKLRKELCCEEHVAEYKKKIYKGVNMYLQDVVLRIKNCTISDNTIEEKEKQLIDICHEIKDIMENKGAEAFSRNFDRLIKNAAEQYMKKTNNNKD